MVCNISKNIDIAIICQYCYRIDFYTTSRFRYYRKVSIIIEISKNVSINHQHLVCDCAIMLEMKVGSVQSSHFKSLSTSFSISSMQ